MHDISEVIDITSEDMENILVSYEYYRTKGVSSRKKHSCLYNKNPNDT